MAAVARAERTILHVHRSSARLHLLCRSVADWPPLAWLARCDAHSGEVSVLHGPRVETTDQWFCEAVWNSPYGSGDFDRTDIVAGSGGRLRDGAVTFVGAGSICDRLQSFDEGNGVVWVSNSLPCLLAAIDGEVDPTHPRYMLFFSTIVNGIDAYERWLPTSVGRVQLTYFDNLRWADGVLSVVPKPGGDRTFTDFASYRGFLDRSMAAIVENSASKGRKHPIRPLATLSSGYDSTTVTVLAHGAGLDEVISFARGFRRRTLGEPPDDDSGRPVAQHLGLTCRTIEPHEAGALEEVPFLAANGAGEDMHFLGAAPHLRGRLLFTGFHGDGVWDKKEIPAAANLAAAGFTGPSLTEFRLWAGFQHCPVPYWGARASAPIHAISNAEEMKPWDVGGGYSRPICRRITEEAGVPRGTFAMTKKAGAAFPLLRRSFLSEASAADYLEWLRARRGAWLRARRLPPPTSLGLDRLTMSVIRQIEETIEKLTWSVATRSGWSALPSYRVIRSLSTLTIPDGAKPPWLPHLRRYVFPWAIDVAARRYGTIGRNRRLEHAQPGAGVQPATH